MPYQGEFADKASHYDLVKDPEIKQFLEDCNYLKPPSEEEGKAIGDRFKSPPNDNSFELPERIIAIDGSNYLTRINERLPSTEVGYLKISSVLIAMKQFNSLRVGRYVDPFKVAELQKDSDALKFLLPSTNICYKDKTSVRDSFRAVVDQHLYSAKTRFDSDNPNTSLRKTLFHLASRRPNEMGTGNPQYLKIHKCPDCEQGPIEVEDIPDPQHCPYCDTEIYPSDCLRLWEEINESQSNNSAMLRFMQVIEHLLPVHYIRYLVENSLVSLGSLAFFIDRPLALFGTSAWLHRPIMQYLAEVNKRLTEINQPTILIIGLQKSGQVIEHISLIERFIKPNRIFAIEDNYRYRYIVPGRKPSQNGFGYETYYGQDFIYKTDSGRSFAFAVPYPFASKDADNFVQIKTEMQRYSVLSRAIALIKHFEYDLYENSVIPIALAHKHSSISLVPGGRVLDILTREFLDN